MIRGQCRSERLQVRLIPPIADVYVVRYMRGAMKTHRYTTDDDISDLTYIQYFNDLKKLLWLIHDLLREKN